MDKFYIGAIVILTLGFFVFVGYLATAAGNCTTTISKTHMGRVNDEVSSGF